MDPYLIAFVVGAVIAFFWIFFRSDDEAAALPREPTSPEEQPVAAPARAVPLTDQLQVLADCGIRLHRDRTRDDLLGLFDASAYEARPYRLLAQSLASHAPGDPPGRPMSDDIARIDVRRVQGPGCYANVAREMARVAGGALPLSGLRDEYDAAVGRYHLHVDIEGFHLILDAACPVDSSDFDMAIVSGLAELLRERGHGRRFVDASEVPGELLLATATPAQLARLRGECGLDFRWVE
jgi:hypothetical protein